MKITSLVENTAGANNVKAKHGLSLYIRTAKHRMLFDLGPDDTVFRNAAALGVDLTAVDTVIVSHGHFDHGGALARFLQVNGTATVYVQAGAFVPHFTRAGLFKIPIGLDASLQADRRIVTLNGDTRLDDELYLFTVPEQPLLRSPMNDVLLDQNGKDAFLHEQDLIVTEGDRNVLVMGCGHAGAANILQKAAPFAPAACVGGFHLYDPVLHRTAPKELLGALAEQLNGSGAAFYTCHCTGKKAYAYLSARMPSLHYLACGETVELP